ncbi:DNA-directed RNA polymerase III subunit RPC9-like [Dysidea avara]|uniref:DNA-directed RNA polymerase III subunit RPC9-like n=1 Tax=Dysidea avara TaxID=196820 RepID=UPI0033199408
MEVINKNVALLSNYEVYEKLLEHQEHMKKKKGPALGKAQNLATVVYQTANYLSSTPCKGQNPKCIGEVLTALKKYNLTKAEKLQLINLTPCTPVEMQLVIEEMDERFKDQEIDEMCEIIRTHLLKPKPDDNDAPAQ